MRGRLPRAADTAEAIDPADAGDTASLGDMVVSQSRRARAARRRKRRVDSADNDLTPAQWAAITAAWGGCAYCTATEAALQRDCVQPISRGGRYTLENVVPACGSCNASKSNSEVTSWMRRKRLDEPAFLLRQREVVIALRLLATTAAGTVTETDQTAAEVVPS